MRFNDTAAATRAYKAFHGKYLYGRQVSLEEYLGFGDDDTAAEEIRQAVAFKRKRMEEQGKGKGNGKDKDKDKGKGKGKGKGSGDGEEEPTEQPAKGPVEGSKPPPAKKMKTK